MIRSLGFVALAALSVVALIAPDKAPDVARLAVAAPHYMPVCESANRASRKVTCIVDGDTGWEHGRKWRYVAIDAPEMPEHAECSAEAQKAYASRDRLRELMADGYTMNWSGRTGFYGRALVTITLNDGRDAGGVLLAEGFAQPWPNSGNVWCGAE